MIGIEAREKAALPELLREARVPRDGVLFVHCAFRNLATDGFRVDGVIAALLDYMAPGTLVMPTMSWRLVTPGNPVFDELATPSHVGVLAELFRTRYATHRSLHPTHSVAAYGRLAAELTSGHHLDDTPCSLDSPYGRATREDAHVLLLGVGLERCTAIHHAEEMVAPDVYLKPPSEAERYQCRSRQGVVYDVRLRRHIKLNRDFPQFTAPLLAKDRLRKGALGGTAWTAMAQRDLLREVTEALEENPRAIIAPPGASIIP
ncbi:MAG: AAC(3) family N-acetyltransferase [Stellaceae bacterium]